MNRVGGIFGRYVRLKSATSAHGVVYCDSCVVCYRQWCFRFEIIFSTTQCTKHFIPPVECRTDERLVDNRKTSKCVLCAREKQISSNSAAAAAIQATIVTPNQTQYRDTKKKKPTRESPLQAMSWIKRTNVCRYCVLRPIITLTEQFLRL